MHGDRCVEVDKTPKPLAHASRRGRDDGPTVTVADQNRVAQIPGEEDPHHIVDMGVEPNRRREQVCALGDTGQGDRNCVVPGAPKRPATCRQHHPPSHAPGTSTNVAIARPTVFRLLVA